MTTAAVIVVNFASSGLLDRNLARLKQPEGVRIVVVDCFSDPAERERVQALGRKYGWIVVALDRNIGFGGGINAGATRALADGDVDVLVPLNPDAVIDQDTLDALAAEARNHPDTLFSPRIVDSRERVWFAGADLYLDDGSTAGAFRRPDRAGRPRREWATGACFAISAALWERVGGFDDDYFLYWEDIDLSHRVLDGGGRLELLDVVVIHDEGQTHTRHGERRAKSETYYYYNIRNRLLYAAKHLDDRQWRRWLRSAPGASYRILLQGGRRQLLTSLTPWRAYVTGIVDGLGLAKDVRASAATGNETRVRPIRVMQSFRAPRPTTNPYIHMLDAALSETDGIEHHRFSWRGALLGPSDVIHVHWPETLLMGRTPLRRFVRHTLFELLLLRAWLTRVRFVRTLHNLELPSDLGRWSRSLLTRLYSRASVTITLNSETRVTGTSILIPHGHYVDWFADAPRAASVPGRLAFVGLVRRYKGVEMLIDAYRALRSEDDHASLAISGSPTSPQLRDEITARAAAVPDVALRLDYLTEEDYALAITSGQVIVLPYLHMHNSGSALAALSLARPVLVPCNEVNLALAEEVGPEWVELFEGDLEPDDLRRALERTSSLQPGSTPDLSTRDWDRAGAAHASAYGIAVGRT